VNYDAPLQVCRRVKSVVVTTHNYILECDLVGSLYKEVSYVKNSHFLI
jgi:hypothetical protein